MKAEQIQQRAADAGAIQLPVVSTWAWLGHATELLQFIVLLISAVAGICSAVYYVQKTRQSRRGED